MSRLADVPAALKWKADHLILEQLVRRRRVPRFPYRHYFIEDEGLHSRIQLQNFYSTFWPHISEPATAHIAVHAASGERLGRHDRLLPAFGSLFLEVRELLAEIGAAAREGTLTVDLEAPQRVLEDLTAFPLPDREDLRIQTPFWMAYYDERENYMYVHSISPDGDPAQGIPPALARFLAPQARDGGSWRSGRLLDARGISEFQLVVVNHSDRALTTILGAFHRTSEPVWEERVPLAPHEVRRVRVDVAALQAGTRDSDGLFRIGLDPLPTANGKPYILMRYGDGPLSLHHG